MSAVAEIAGRYSDVKSAAPKVKIEKKKTGSFLTSWWNSRKFDRAWFERNLDNGEVFINTLEVEFMEFEQDYFVQYSKEVSDKLKRLGFEQVDTIKDKYEFVTYVYSSKYNISIALYKPEMKTVIYKAKQVVEDALIGGDTASAVFKAVVKSFM